MDADTEAIRARLRVVRLDEPISLGDGANLYAEDPETGCMGFGEVEAEAVGNAVSAVVRYERDESDGPPYVKVTGRLVRKSWDGGRSGALGRVRDLL